MVELKPQARFAPFVNAMDCYDFVFRDEALTKLDVVKPGFFNQHRSELVVGTMIECRLGVAADGITVFRVQVIHNPQYSATEDILVSVGRAQTFTPVRHAGKPAEDEKAAPETDATEQKGVAA